MDTVWELQWHFHRWTPQSVCCSGPVACRPFLFSESPLPVPTPVHLQHTPGPCAQNRHPDGETERSRLPPSAGKTLGEIHEGWPMMFSHLRTCECQVTSPISCFSPGKGRKTYSGEGARLCPSGEQIRAWARGNGYKKPAGG